DIEGRIIQTMEEHSLLHWRKWIDVFNVSAFTNYAIHLLLGQLRLWKVRWGISSCLRRQTVLDQPSQLLQVEVGQPFHTGRPMQGTAIGPVHMQASLQNTPLDFQQIGTPMLRTLVLSRSLLCQLEQRSFVLNLIKLPQIVETDLRFWSIR